MSFPRPKPRSMTDTRVRILTKHSSLLPLVLVAIVALAVVVIPSSIPPAHAAGTPTVFVAPSTHASVAKGASVNFWVNVSSMPAFNGFNILVKVNNLQLTPASISTTGIIFLTPSEDINCVNNVGIGCVSGLDGPGIAHEEVFCLGCFTASDHGLLFNITFTGVANSPTGSVVDVYNDVIEAPPIQAPHLTVGGMYGAAQPDFTISASPFSQSVAQGRTGSATISLTSVNGFAGTLALSNSSVAAGTTNQLPVKLSTTSVVLTAGATQPVGVTISPASSTAGGAYDLILEASGGSPNLIHQTDLNITVTVPDFSIVASPTSMVNPLGSSNSTTLTLASINTFTGKVTISFTVSPIVANSPSITLTNSSHTGSSVTVDLSSGGSASATLTVTSTTSTATNSYSIRVTGVSGSLSRSTSVSVSVVPFSISASPVSLFLSNSTTSFVTSTLTITSLATSHINVTLSSSVSPSTTHPLKVDFANATTPSPGVPTLIEGVAAGGMSSLTLNVTVTCTSMAPIKCTALNTYTVRVTGTVGTASRAVNVAATVAIPDFAISATSPADFNTGATGSSTITVTPSGGFTGTVTLNTVVSPSTGLTANCPPSLTVTSSSTVTGTCTPSSSTPGTYGISITGTGASQIHTAAATVHVGDFSISASSPSGIPGSSISSTVTLTSTFNFVGSVALTDTVPSGLTCSPFSSTPVSLAANGTGTSGLSCSSPTAGSFAVDITDSGTPGTASHPITATFTFSADFTISATSPADFNTGATGSSTITVTPSGGFTGTVTLNTVVSPSTGLTANCPPSLTVTSGAVTGTCAPSSSTPGTYLVTITGTGGGQTHTASFVSHVGDLTVSTITPVDVNSGATGSAISVSLTSTFNFAGTISITAATSPVTGLTVTCPAPVSIAANATVSASCTLSSTTAGTYGVTILGAGSPGTASHSAPATVHVGDFSISASSPSGIPGSSISSTVTLTSTFNFVGSVALSDTPLPSGLTCNAFTVTPVSLTANGTGTSNLSCSSPTAGSFIVNINGAAATGTASQSTSATFNFAADFSISATSPADFIAGGTGSSTITITPAGGFTGTVALTATISPSTGLLANCPTSLAVTGSSAVTGTCAPSSSTPGTYSVTITATSGSLVHTASFVSHVSTAPTPTISSVTISPNGSATVGQTVSVTVTVSNPGNVNVDFTIQVRWASVNVTQMSETLLANQQKSFTLSWDTTMYGAGTSTLSVVIFNDGAWSDTSAGSSYSLTAPPQPFFTSTVIATISGVSAAVVLLGRFLGLRRRRKPAAL